MCVSATKNAKGSGITETVKPVLCSDFRLWERHTRQKCSLNRKKRGAFVIRVARFFALTSTFVHKIY